VEDEPGPAGPPRRRGGGGDLMEGRVLVALLLILLANIGILGLNLKLYSEILKQAAQDKRR